MTNLPETSTFEPVALSATKKYQSMQHLIALEARILSAMRAMDDVHQFDTYKKDTYRTPNLCECVALLNAGQSVYQFNTLEFNSFGFTDPRVIILCADEVVEEQRQASLKAAAGQIPPPSTACYFGRVRDRASPRVLGERTLPVRERYRKVHTDKWTCPWDGADAEDCQCDESTWQGCYMHQVMLTPCEQAEHIAHMAELAL
jgi:hypothetical protein